jgi:hypothetical protein
LVYPTYETTRGNVLFSKHTYEKQIDEKGICRLLLLQACGPIIFLNVSCTFLTDAIFPAGLGWLASPSTWVVDATDKNPCFLKLRLKNITKVFIPL